MASAGSLASKPNSFENEILLPVGLSFYILQTLGYVFDVYRGDIEPERHFGKFSLFVSFFPKLVAGPIEKAGDLLPQIHSLDKRPSESMFYPGVGRIFWGLFKKVAVADTIALYTDAVFNNIDQYQGATFYVATVLFAIQIYCDLSGYADIAIGSARLLGVRLSENFQLPYNSTTIQDFWSRWHCTFYRWFHSYVYSPMARLRPGKRGVAIAVLTTFSLAGLWHGVSWRFALFGLVHGIWVLLELAFYSRFSRPTKLPGQLLAGLTTLHVWLFSLIWFRCATLADGTTLLSKMVTSFAFQPLDKSVLARTVIGVLVLVAVEQLLIKRQNFEQIFEKTGQLGMGCIMLLSLVLMIVIGNSDGGVFLFFQV